MSSIPALIAQQGAADAPVSVPIAPGFDIELASVSAEFDGASAPADFIPCLTVYAQSGQIIGRYPADRSLAAGDAARVTFAPFLGGAGGGSAAAVGLSFGWENFGNQTIPVTPTVAQRRVLTPVASWDTGLAAAGWETFIDSSGAADFVALQPTGNPPGPWADYVTGWTVGYSMNIDASAVGVTGFDVGIAGDWGPWAAQQHIPIPIFGVTNQVNVQASITIPNLALDPPNFSCDIVPYGNSIVVRGGGLARAWGYRAW